MEVFLNQIKFVIIVKNLQFLKIIKIHIFVNHYQKLKKLNKYHFVQNIMNNKNVKVVVIKNLLIKIKYNHNVLINV